jgi:hypothetical protein
MTAKKDLKRRVRERQVKTGESYVTARRHVLAAAPDVPADVPAADVPAPEPRPAPAIDVDELQDITEAGAALGFHCRIYASSKLARHVDLDGLLQHIREILSATSEDPEMAHMRGAILRGERPPFGPRDAQWWMDVRAFLRRATTGIGGITESGNMLAFSHGGRMILADIGFRQTPADVPPRLMLSSLGEDGFSMSTRFVR